MAGILAGVVVGIGIVVVLIVCLYRRMKRKVRDVKRNPEENRDVRIEEDSNQGDASNKNLSQNVYFNQGQWLKRISILKW